MNPAVDEHGATLPPKAAGLRRWVFLSLGIVFVALGVIGAILPLLPTTPFLLLASYFFIRSSSRLHRWLLRSPVLGHYLKEWHQHRGVRLHVKVIALTMLALAVGSSLIFSKLPWYLLILLVLLAAIGATVVIRLPTLRGPRINVKRTERVSQPEPCNRVPEAILEKKKPPAGERAAW